MFLASQIILCELVDFNFMASRLVSIKICHTSLFPYIESWKSKICKRFAEILLYEIPLGKNFVSGQKCDTLSKIYLLGAKVYQNIINRLYTNFSIWKPFGNCVIKLIGNCEVSCLNMITKAMYKISIELSLVFENKI